MDEVVTVAEVEQSRPLSLVPTSFDTPVWRYLLWLENYAPDPNLHFMAAEDTQYNRVAMIVQNIIIDFEVIMRADSLAQCREHEKSFFTDGPVLYLHVNKHHPPSLYRIKNGVVYGFTNTKPMKNGRTYYLPDLLQAPAIEQSADPMTYSKMRFDSGSFVFNNSHSVFDNFLNVFGNALSIKIGKGSMPIEQFEMVAQYYISNLMINLNTATIEGKDRRELLSTKAPNEFYTLDKYPKIQENLLDKVMPEIYGYCVCAPGACLESEDVYIDAVYETLKDWYTYRFSSYLTDIERIEMKMTDDTWTEIYPGLGIPGHDAYVTPNPFPVVFHPENGTVEVYYAQTFPNGDRAKAAQSIRATGVFNPQRNPGDIVRELIRRYNSTPFLDQYYDTLEWEKELKKLPDIGIVLDTQKEIFAWAEIIQNSSLVGFQLLSEKGRYTARLDNPNRPESFEIKHSEILHLDECEVDFSGEHYASYANVKFAKNFSEKESRQVVNMDYRQDILDLHMIDQSYENESLMATEALARLKTEIVLQDYLQLRPVIRNIRLNGFDYFNLRLYDTGYIDFKVTQDELKTWKGAMVALLQFIDSSSTNKSIWGINKPADRKHELIHLTPPANTVQREFIGRLRCQIINHSIDPLTGIVTIDVRQRDYLEVIPFD